MSATLPASLLVITSPPTTAPPPSRSPPEDGARCSGCRAAATGASTTSSTWRPSPRSASATPPVAPSTTARSPKVTPARKRSGRSNGASATPSTPASATTPSRQRSDLEVRQGNRGTSLSPGRPAHAPNTGSSDKPLPDQTRPYDLDQHAVDRAPITATPQPT